MSWRILIGQAKNGNTGGCFMTHMMFGSDLGIVSNGAMGMLPKEQFDTERQSNN